MSTQYGMLKSYCHELREYGLKKLAEELCADGDPALPAKVAALGQQTPMSFNDATEEQEKLNRALMDDGKYEVLKLSFKTCWQAEAWVVRLGDKTATLVEQALESYCLIVGMVTKVDEKEGYALYFDQRKLLGGWDQVAGNYDAVNLPAGLSFSRAEQNATVFGMRPRDIKPFTKAAKLEFAYELIAGAIDTIMGKKGSAFAVPHLHVMFCFNAHTSYSYHQDAPDLVGEVDYTMMLMLSPGKSSMRVAGAGADFEYTYPGAACFFDACKLYHRSGTALLRTVKLAFFIRLTDAIDPEEEGEGSPIKKPKVDEEVKSEPKVKQEVIPVPVPEVKPEEKSDQVQAEENTAGAEAAADGDDGAGVFPIPSTMESSAEADPKPSPSEVAAEGTASKETAEHASPRAAAASSSSAAAIKEEGPAVLAEAPEVVDKPRLFKKKRGSPK